MSHDPNPASPPISVPAPTGSTSPAPEASSLPVGDVVIRQEAAGYGIFNYRGEPVLETPLSTPGEAERLAAEIVAPWHGRVRSADPGFGR